MQNNLSAHKLKSLSHLALAYLPNQYQRSSVRAFLQDDNSQTKMLLMIKHACNHSALFKSYLENSK